MTTARLQTNTVVPLAPPWRDARTFGLESASWSIPSVWKRYTLVQHAYLRTLGVGKPQPRPVADE
jgi:hypothetical protein